MPLPFSRNTCSGPLYLYLEKTLRYSFFGGGRRAESSSYDDGAGDRVREEEGEHPDPAEAQASVGMAAPVEPSSAEREEHARNHLPYRSWCDVCVRARALATGHSSHRDVQDRYQKPQIVLDYWFVDGRLPVLVMYERNRQALFGHLDRLFVGRFFNAPQVSKVSES